MREPDVTPDDGVFTNGDAPQYGGVGIDGDMVSDDGMSRHIDRPAIVIHLKVFRSKRDALIEGDMVANDASLPDDNTRTMVDGEILAYARSRVNVYSCGRMSLLCKDAWQYWYTHDVQLVGHPVVEHGLHHGVTENHLREVLHCRVVVEDGPYVGV